MQTFIVMYLRSHEIIHLAGQRSADTLARNKAKKTPHSRPPVRTARFILLQTFTTLDLSNNTIGDLGAQQLADALKLNKVRKRPCVRQSLATMHFRRSRH